MGSLIRASAVRGYSELVRELGGDPAAFLARFGIPVVAEQQPDDFISFAAWTCGLEITAEELACPDFGLRLSGRQDLEILGPIAVIARNASTVLGGVEAIGRFLYIHSPALKLTARRSSGSGIEFTYEMTEPVPSIQGACSRVPREQRSLVLLGELDRVENGPWLAIPKCRCAANSHNPSPTSAAQPAPMSTSV